MKFSVTERSFFRGTGGCIADGIIQKKKTPCILITGLNFLKRYFELLFKLRGTLTQNTSIALSLLM
jgi:hypothetical protein